MQLRAMTAVGLCAKNLQPNPVSEKLNVPRPRGNKDTVNILWDTYLAASLRFLFDCQIVINLAHHSTSTVGPKVFELLDFVAAEGLRAAHNVTPPCVTAIPNNLDHQQDKASVG